MAISTIMIILIISLMATWPSSQSERSRLLIFALLTLSCNFINYFFCMCHLERSVLTLIWKFQGKVKSLFFAIRIFQPIKENALFFVASSKKTTNVFWSYCQTHTIFVISLMALCPSIILFFIRSMTKAKQWSFSF